MKIVCIIQARTGSTRLPNKILKTVNQISILDYVLERVKLSKEIDDIVLATTSLKKDDVLVEHAIKEKVNCFRGSEEDVLSRYYKAAKKFKADIIVRITSDDPLVDPRIIDKVIKKHIEKKADYTSNNLLRTYPLGLDIEVFNFVILEEAFEKATEKYEREKVSPYIKYNPKIYKLYNVEADGKLKRPEIRITLDTKEDLELIKKILLHFDSFDFKAEDVIDFLDNNPRLLNINKHIKQKGLKE